MLAKEPHAALDVPLDAYLRRGSNYETVRLIALSDRVYGRDENYGVLFDSALEAIREHPGTYARGVADAFWEFLRQAPLREDVVRREQTAPEAPPATFEADGVVFPNPQAHVLVEGVPYGFVWCASDYVDSCTLDDPSLVWTDAERQRRYREIVRQVRAWDAELPARDGVDVVTELLNRVTPRFPVPRSGSRSGWSASPSAGRGTGGSSSPSGSWRGSSSSSMPRRRASRPSSRSPSTRCSS